MHDELAGPIHLRVHRAVHDLRVLAGTVYDVPVEQHPQHPDVYADLASTSYIGRLNARTLA